MAGRTGRHTWPGNMNNLLSRHPYGCLFYENKKPPINIVEVIKVDLVSWDMIWEVAGPFIIMGAVMVIVGLLCFVILSSMRSGLLKDLFRVISILLIVGSAWMSLQISAGIWAM